MHFSVQALKIKELHLGKIYYPSGKEDPHSSTLELWAYWKCMNNLKIEIHKKLLKEGSEKFQWAEDFTNIRIDEICFQEKLPIEEIICVLCFLVSFLAVK